MMPYFWNMLIRLKLITEMENNFRFRTEFNRKVGKDMTHIPYGYRIENGMTVVDQADAERIKLFIKNTLM